MKPGAQWPRPRVIRRPSRSFAPAAGHGATWQMPVSSGMVTEPFTLCCRHPALAFDAPPPPPECP
ncbi:hypothetical protein GCM10020218_064500 [Dactylosporangium vinaceum]